MNEKVILSRIDTLRHNIKCLAREVCALQDGGGGGVETDPIFSASDAFSITNADRTSWSTASSWGNHASAGYAHLATTETFTGNKRFDGTFTLNTDVVFAINGDYSIGSDAVRPGNIYSLNVISPSFTSNTAASAFFGSTLTTQRVLFQQGTTSQIVGGFHLTSGNFFLQAAGTVSADSGFKFDVTGTSRFTGNITLAGDIIPEASGTRSIGSASLRLNNIYPTNILKGSAGSSMNMGLTNTSDIFLRIQPTTNNIYIQATGVAPTETGYKLSVNGTGATNGAFDVIGASRFTGNVTVAGNILPEADGTRVVGGSALRYSGYFVSLFKPSGGGMNFANTGGTDVFFRFQPTTNNVLIQAAGATYAETNYRLTVDGTGATNGGLSVTGIVKFVTATTYADNSAAVSGGLTTGQIYKHADGTLAIVL